MFLVGEENGSDGARVAADLEPRGRFLINGEPTENRLSIGQKGSLRVDLKRHGPRRPLGLSRRGRERHRGAARHHRAHPRRCRCRIDPLLGPSTLNVGLIEGGVAPNVLAPEASAQILIRTVEPTGPLKAAIQALAAPGVAVGVPGRAAEPQGRGARRQAGTRPS